MIKNVLTLPVKFSGLARSSTENGDFHVPGMICSQSGKCSQYRISSYTDREIKIKSFLWIMGENYSKIITEGVLWQHWDLWAVGSWQAVFVFWSCSVPVQGVCLQSSLQAAVCVGSLELGSFGAPQPFPPGGDCVCSEFQAQLAGILSKLCLKGTLIYWYCCINSNIVREIDVTTFKQCLCK